MPPSLLDEISPPKHPVFGPTELSRFKAWTIPICLYFSQKKWSPEGSQTLFFFLSSWRLSTSLYRMRKKKRSGLRDVEEKKRIGVWLVGASHKPPSPHTHQTAQKCRNENNKKKKVYYIFCVCILLLVYAPTACRAFHIFEDDHWFCAKHVTKLSKQNLFFLFPFCREFSVFCFKDNK